MRKILIHFLMFVMLVPGLACGPFMGAKAHAAMGSMPNCHMTMGAAGKISGEGRFFFKDCLKIDLKAPGHTDAKTPDVKITKVFYDLPVTAVSVQTIFADAQTIRGPPPDWPAFSQTQPSILRTSQRLRL
jgi:hypothetical protein